MVRHIKDARDRNQGIKYLLAFNLVDRFTLNRGKKLLFRYRFSFISQPRVSSITKLGIKPLQIGNMAQSAQSSVIKDAAMKVEVPIVFRKPTGGIDLTSDKALTVQNNGQGIKFHIDPAMLQQLQNTLGFVPVIINIQPLKSLQEFLGLRTQASQSNEG